MRNYPLKSFSLSTRFPEKADKIVPPAEQPSGRFFPAPLLDQTYVRPHPFWTGMNVKWILMRHYPLKSLYNQFLENNSIGTTLLTWNFFKENRHNLIHLTPDFDNDRLSSIWLAVLCTTSFWSLHILKISLTVVSQWQARMLGGTSDMSLTPGDPLIILDS